MESIYNDHHRIDERSLALHELVAQKIQAAPELLDKVRENLRRWQRTRQNPSPALTEWEKIIDSSVGDVLAALVDRSEKATRLRQSSPFCGILSETERRTIYESYSTRTYHTRRAESPVTLKLSSSAVRQSMRRR
jgi:hypothetical protein